MNQGWVQQIVNDFWNNVGYLEPFPRNLEPAILWALPVAIIKISRLCVKDVQTWLKQNQISFRFECVNRSLRGCLLAYGGKGILFVDGTDTHDEYRVTLAHETGHFLVDYIFPRQLAVDRLGDGILEVFDGLRPPMVNERIDAIFNKANLGVHTHLMHRDASSLGCSGIFEAENRADEVALELLAPKTEVYQRLKHFKKSKRFQHGLSTVISILKNEFGLPLDLAEGYGKSLYRSWYRGPSFREWLGIL